MCLLSRFLAVIAIALSPVWGVQSIHAASSPAPSRLPQWPSYVSEGCSVDGAGTFSCAPGGTVYTQIPQLYQCAIPAMTVNTVGGNFTATVQDPAGSAITNIFDAGDFQWTFGYFYLIGQVTFDINTSSGGYINFSNLHVSPCAIPDTATPVPATSTPNPSDTSTPVPDTATVGPSHTPTAIPTFTPIPVGHNTFTPTVTRTGTITPVATGTGTATPTPPSCPFGWGFYDCDFQLQGGYTGSWHPGVTPWSTAPWTYGGGSQYDWGCDYSGVPGTGICHAASVMQENTVPQDGVFCVNATVAGTGALTGWAEVDQYTSYAESLSSGSVNVCTPTLAGGTVLWLYLGNSDGTYTSWANIQVLFAPSGSTTPIGTYTSTPTATPLPGTPTETGTATDTPVSIPGAKETAIPTSTECPGGCIVTALTAIPGLSTRVTVDTSPFDPLKALSLSRSSCQPFGYAQIPYPVIHGTPAVGSTTPLSVTWTVPNTSTYYDGVIGGDIILTNTAVQPCAMVREIPPVTWDITYWLSVLMLAIGFILWLIGFVGRLSGDHSVNG